MKKLFTIATPKNSQNDRVYAAAGTQKKARMLILVLVLKDSLRTFFKSLSLSWSLGVRSLSLSLSLWVRSLSLSWSLWSSPCPCPCFMSLQGLVSIIPLLGFILIILYCSINAYN